MPRHHDLIETVETAGGVYEFRRSWQTGMMAHVVEFSAATKELAGDLLPTIGPPGDSPLGFGRDGVYIGELVPRRWPGTFDTDGEPYPLREAERRSWRAYTRTLYKDRHWQPRINNSWRRTSWDHPWGTEAPPVPWTYAWMPIDEAMCWVVGAFEQELAAYVAEKALKVLALEVARGAE